MNYDGPWLTVDCAVFDSEDRLLLVRRRFSPFQGQYALPGGFVENGETIEAAARRELEEETGVKAGALHLIGVYSDPGRDPRHHTASVAYLVLLDQAEAVAGDDAEAARFMAEWRTLPLAFDHRLIVDDAARLRAGLKNNRKKFG